MQPAVYRLELTLRKPAVGFFPKPTVVLNGRGQPAQWGTGTWQVTVSDGATIGVYLYNRLWKFGAAEFSLDGEAPTALVYHAPVLPFLPGRFVVSTER
jgi:hypothetical protein